MAKRRMSTFERLRRGKKLNRRERRELERCLEAEGAELQVVHPNAAGIDVGNESHFVGVRPRASEPAVQEFGSWTADLGRMVEWLKSQGVKTVAMQSTGVYWIALYEILEQAGFEVYLVNARGTKNLPGRKSDVQECQWLRKLHTYGLLRNSFRPPEQIRGVRTLWRLRERHVEEAGRAVQHMQKALTTMNVQLANALSNLGGTTGLAILRAILAGERDPRQLAKLRDWRVRASEEEIAHSLEGNWREDVLFELQQVVEAYDFLQRQIAACDLELQKYLAALPSREVPGTQPVASPSVAVEARPQGRKAKAKRPSKGSPSFDLAQELRRTMGVDLMTIDGINVMTAQVILSEIGPDLSAFPSEAHFSAWLGLAPQRDISGGKVIAQKSRRVKNRVANALRMAAESLSRSESYLGARYRHLRGRLGGLKAIKAMARYLACLVHRLLTKGQAWVDRGSAEYERKRKGRELIALQRRAADLGMRLVAA
ncbi:MAG TPA: IS110 family transposase [Terriglobia bacterium]|nr:IS110 family transposase [Terriglobia bacterium]